LAEVAHAATISVGVATAEQKMDELSDLMKTADQALYAAKRAGRNRVMCGVSHAAAPHVVPGEDCLMVAAQLPQGQPAPLAGIAGHAKAKSRSR